MKNTKNAKINYNRGAIYSVNATLYYPAKKGEDTQRVFEKKNLLISDPNIISWGCRCFKRAIGMRLRIQKIAGGQSMMLELKRASVENFVFIIRKKDKKVFLNESHRWVKDPAKARTFASLRDAYALMGDNVIHCSVPEKMFGIQLKPRTNE